jgi:hypothetical protein
MLSVVLLKVVAPLTEGNSFIARVPRQVVEVVHDDGNEQIEHDEGAEEDEGHEVDVRQGRPAVLAGVQ